MQEADQVNATFPERIYELAREQRLGVPIKKYRPAMFWWFFVVGICTILLASSLPTDIHMYMQDKANAQQLARLDTHCQSCLQVYKNEDNQTSASLLSYDSNQIWNDTSSVVGGLLLLILLLYLQQYLCIYRCNDGLLWSFGWLSFFKKKGSLIALHWDEIGEVYWKGNRIHALRLAESEQGLFLNRFRKTQDISKCVESEVTPRLFAQTLEQYKRTGEVYFDTLSISHDGLAITNPSISWGNGERVVPWQDLEDIRFADDSLSIKRHGVWQLWAGSSRRQKHLSRIIPNPTVYVALAKYLLENSRIEEKRIGK